MGDPNGPKSAEVFLLGTMFRGGWLPLRRLNSELLGVFGVQSLPPAELYGLGADHAADGSSVEKTIQNIETNVPPGSTHGDEAATDIGPQREARAASKGFEFPAHIEVAPIVLKRLGSVGSRHFCFGNVRCGRSHRGELRRGSDRTQVPIGVEGRPLAQSASGRLAPARLFRASGAVL